MADMHDSQAEKTQWK